MESTQSILQPDRNYLLNQWLNQNLTIQTVTPLPHDASFRRYSRVKTRDKTYIVMDAPPPQENVVPFIAIAETLRNLGLHAPEIIAADREQGFLLLTDLGDTTFLSQLRQSKDCDLLYRSALLALSRLQTCQKVPHHTLPYFDTHWMQQEWAWHQDWFLYQWLEVTAAPSVTENIALLIKEAAAQPQVFIHRDYHSANLMMLARSSQPSIENVGILDFQDAFYGPITYDAVSLLRDCYIAWPQDQVETWITFYWQILTTEHGLSVDLPTFIRWFDWMGILRHLKALFTFARKAIRDQATQYLLHVPRTYQYLLNVTANYSELSALHHHLCQVVAPALARKGMICGQ